jgi:hypothetical protein
MKTFIFLKNYKRNGKLRRTIVGMVQSDCYPSSLIKCSGSKFYGCDCVEIKEQCHVEIGLADTL